MSKFTVIEEPHIEGRTLTAILQGTKEEQPKELPIKQENLILHVKPITEEAKAVLKELEISQNKSTKEYKLKRNRENSEYLTSIGHVIVEEECSICNMKVHNPKSLSCSEYIIQVAFERIHWAIYKSLKKEPINIPIQWDLWLKQRDTEQLEFIRILEDKLKEEMEYLEEERKRKHK